MIEVALHEAEFFARHGYYRVEQDLGNRFLVDIAVSFKPAENLNEDNLLHTLNYERLHQIAEAEMAVPRKLLETVAQGILDQIRAEFGFAEAIKVQVRKLNPPLKGQVKASSVTITYQK
ncbi:dihydroneopterin aldolase [Mucilaginibacter sp. RS28]|uniref:7,8-dihydroneopterin aldolase n=1 Tax=Mucilaginibacter straminoryzae TaxID=2932774 RepID=A0A9X1X1Z3_9SPHI|nr:dihydroneopterin aldolase [Mucilaginibacter straminoryzae]MCJ8209528.1 dihydroneopterin aldolase [Mucilaginibacter straminoryzae]